MKSCWKFKLISLNGRTEICRCVEGAIKIIPSFVGLTNFTLPTSYLVEIIGSILFLSPKYIVLSHLSFSSVPMVYGWLVFQSWLKVRIVDQATTFYYFLNKYPNKILAHICLFSCRQDNLKSPHVSVVVI